MSTDALMRQCLECGLKLALRAHLYVDRKLVFSPVGVNKKWTHLSLGSKYKDIVKHKCYLRQW